MVGALKSRRCTLCKSKKIKCDEAWPTCGNCRQAAKTCSGPSSNLKFVVESVGPGRKSNPSSQSSCRGNATLTPMRQRATESGAIFSKLKLYAPANPSSGPSSPSDRVVKRYVNCLDSASGSGFDISVSMLYLDSIPRLMNDNEALYTAIDTYLSAWTAIRTASVSEDIINLRLYTKALRSLRNKLDDPKERLADQTLAATFVLTRIESTFDWNRRAFQVSHAQGIYWLLKHKGPPKPGETLRFHLAFQALGNMFLWLIKGQSPNFYTEPEWFNALRDFVDTTTLEPSIMSDTYRLGLSLIYLPDIILKARTIDPMGISTEPSQTILAYHLLDQLDEIASTIAGRDEPKFQSLFQEGQVVEAIDLESPLGTRFEFRGETNMEVLNYVAWYCMIAIMVDRIRQHLYRILGLDMPELEGKCYEWSSRIWRCIPHILSMRPLVASHYIGGLLYAFEAGNPAERAYVLSAWRQIDSFRYRKPFERDEQSILAATKDQLGRLPHV